MSLTQSKTARSPGARFVLALATILAVVLGGLGIQAPAAYAAAPFSSDFLYGTNAGNGGQIYRIDPATGASVYILQTPVAETINSIALTADGNEMLVASAARVFMYDAPSERWTVVARPANDAAGTTMGGVNSKSGWYYYGGRDTADTSLRTFRFAAFDTVSRRLVSRALTVTLPGNTGVNGDLVFDQQGNMYILTSDAAEGVGSQVWRVDASTVSTTTGGTAIGTPVGAKFANTQLSNGAAYGPDGYGYLSRTLSGGGSELLRTDPVSFSLISRIRISPAAVQITDLASRAFQPTVLVDVDLPDGRYGDGDQFHITLKGPDANDPAISAETTGTESGVQNQEEREYIGRTAAFAGDTYTIEQTAAGTTNLGNYTTTWVCRDITNDREVSSGEGNRGTFSVPSSPIIDIDCRFTNVPVRPGLTLEKSADRTELVAGETITYEFLVRNTGNVRLDDLTITEGEFTGFGTMSAVSCDPTSLAPDESVTCTATYEVTQADVDRGTVENTATATGTPPNGADPVISEPSEAVVPSEADPGISIVKSADASELVAGETIIYTFVVENTGNVTLSDVAVDEGDFSGSGSLSAVVCDDGAASLAPGDTVVCTASYEMTQADVDAGTIENSATASGTPPGGGDPISSEPSSVRIPQEPAPAISLVKRADPVEFTAGQTITYTFAVRNTGNVTLSDVVVNEGDFSGTGSLSAVVCEDGAASLAPGDVVDCTASYEATQEDVDRGSITNSATASGTPPEGEPVTSEPSEAEVTADPAPAIELTKSADRTELVAGQTITY
ncbi:hypothetical protein ACFWE1_01105, partial [Agromyces sp. NPDC060279]